MSITDKFGTLWEAAKTLGNAEMLQRLGEVQQEVMSLIEKNTGLARRVSELEEEVRQLRGAARRA